jgi:hypothetical protein
MKLVQNSKAVFRFRKLAAMPFSFLSDAFKQAFPFVLLSSFLFTVPSVISGLIGFSRMGDLYALMNLVVMTGVFVCHAVVFWLTLTVAVQRLLPEANTGAISRFEGFMGLTERAWQHFFGVLAGLLTFGFLFSMLMGLPLQAALSEFRTTGDAAAASRGFLWHVALEFINPWFWLASFVAGYYFRNAAKRAIVIFEAVLDGLELRVTGAPSLTYVVDKNRKLFGSLVSVPHFLFGMAFAVATGLAQGSGVTDLILLTNDFSGSPLIPLAATFALNVLLGTLFSLVAGFIAVIWLAAAQTAGVVDNAIVADAGFGVRKEEPVALAGSKPVAAAKPLAGSGPVVRRSGWGL